MKESVFMNMLDDFFADVEEEDIPLHTWLDRLGAWVRKTYVAYPNEVPESKPDNQKAKKRRHYTDPFIVFIRNAAERGNRTAQQWCLDNHIIFKHPTRFNKEPNHGIRTRKNITLRPTKTTTKHTPMARQQMAKTRPIRTNGNA